MGYIQLVSFTGMRVRSVETPSGKVKRVLVCFLTCMAAPTCTLGTPPAWRRVLRPPPWPRPCWLGPWTPPCRWAPSQLSHRPSHTKNSDQLD